MDACRCDMEGSTMTSGFGLSSQKDGVATHGAEWGCGSPCILLCGVQCCSAEGSTSLARITADSCRAEEKGTNIC